MLKSQYYCIIRGIKVVMVVIMLVGFAVVLVVLVLVFMAV